LQTTVRIAKECQGACVREICIADEVSDNVGGKEPSLWIIGGQEFDDAEPVLLILPVRLEIVFVLSFSRSPDPFPGVLVQNSRYTDDTQSVGSLVFPPAIYRALRCDRCLVITT
jgi:hypothetical protein